MQFVPASNLGAWRPRYIPNGCGVGAGCVRAARVRDVGEEKKWGSVQIEFLFCITLLFIIYAF